MASSMKAAVRHGLRWLWQAMPMPGWLRNELLQRYHPAVTLRRFPAAQPLDAIPPGPLLVAGFFGSVLGLGEAARGLVSGMAAAGFQPSSIDLSGDLVPRKQEFEPLNPSAPAGPGGALILCVNPPEFGPSLDIAGRAVYENRYRIAYIHWELQVVPASWQRIAPLVNEVWVASDFAARAMRRRFDLPVRIVPPKVSAMAVTATRSDLGLPEDRFIVYSAFDMNSSLSRKNPLAAVRAFRKAFGTSPAVLLLLKATQLDRAHPVFTALAAEIAELPNVRLVDEVWPRSRLHEILANVDAVLSLHRAEGFGLSLAEGMAHGKPVVATAWSGNMDFMDADCARLVDYRLVPVADPQRIYRSSRLRRVLWAEPDIEQAAAHLVALSRDASLRQAIGRRARERLADFCAPDRFLTAMGTPLRRLTGRRD